MNALREGLPPLPDRMATLPIDERGYPVPWFVAVINGKPDHRVMDGSKIPRALHHELCWMCGQKLGRFKSFCIGPMCSISRAISEPPSHLSCVRFAVTACPFLTRPKAQRRSANLPEQARDPAGVFIERNPGAICLWTTLSFRPFFDGGGGLLFRLGEPESVEWYAEGRPATRAEVDASIASGLHLLREAADGDGDLADLELRIAREKARLDACDWPAAA